MGMFGSKVAQRQAGALNLPPPSVGSRVLNQIGMNLIGVDVLGMKRAQALRDAQKGFMDDLQGQLGPQYSEGPQLDVQVPDAGQTREVPQMQLPQRTSNGLDINSPDLPALALKAQRLGVPMTQLLDVLKAQQPDVRFDRGYGYNGKTGDAMGGYHADLDKGIRPGEGGSAEAVPGYADAAAGIEGAKTGAQERAKAPYTFPTFTGPDGRPVTVSAETAALLGANGGVISQGQSPAQASAAKIVGDAKAGAQVTLPTDLNSVDTAIDTATKLRNHPALDKRTGAWSILPAVPGTPGAAFEAYKQQVLGQGFMNARQALKGGGQITDYEGGKAEQAIIRAKAAQSPEDFRAAVDDYVSALRRGREILQQKAGATPAATQRQPATPRMAGKGFRILSVE